MPVKAGRRERNPLSGLSRWKILDNLRRSLVPAALMLLLLMGWTVLPSGWLWTAVVLGIMLIPILAAALLALERALSDRPPFRDVATQLHVLALRR